MTNPDYITTQQNHGKTVDKGPIPLDRCDREVQTPSHWAEVEKPNSIDIDQGMKTTVAEVGESRCNRLRCPLARMSGL